MKSCQDRERVVKCRTYLSPFFPPLFLLSAVTFSLCLVPQQLLLSGELNPHVRFVALTQCIPPLTIPLNTIISLGAVPPTLVAVLTGPTSSTPALQAAVRHGMSPGSLTPAVSPT